MTKTPQKRLATTSKSASSLLSVRKSERLRSQDGFVSSSSTPSTANSSVATDWRQRDGDDCEIVALRKLETTGHELIEAITCQPERSGDGSSRCAYDEVIHLVDHAPRFEVPIRTGTPHGVPCLRLTPYLELPSTPIHMKTQLTLTLALGGILSFANSLSSFAQTAELQTTFTQGQLTATAAVFGIPSESFSADYDVNMYRVTYNMPYLEDTVEVSGALFVPQAFDDPCGLPIHVYMHGTIFKRTDAPSFMSIEGTFGGLMSTLGQLVLMPDYVGLGTSELMHPYVHARSESDAGYFLMKAASTLSEELGYALNGQNFISGYSQGGHAAMALARDLATTAYGDDFPLTAAVPGSGP